MNLRRHQSSSLRLGLCPLQLLDLLLGSLLTLARGLILRRPLLLRRPKSSLCALLNELLRQLLLDFFVIALPAVSTSSSRERRVRKTHQIRTDKSNGRPSIGSSLPLCGGVLDFLDLGEVLLDAGQLSHDGMFLGINTVKAEGSLFMLASRF